MIQLIGRVIHKKPDGRNAQQAVLYVEGTSEGPANGAQVDFGSFLMGTADENLLAKMGD